MSKVPHIQFNSTPESYFRKLIKQKFPAPNITRSEDVFWNVYFKPLLTQFHHIKNADGILKDILPELQRSLTSYRGYHTNLLSDSISEYIVAINHLFPQPSFQPSSSQLSNIPNFETNMEQAQVCISSLGFTSAKPGQLEIIAASLANMDVLVSIPTGGGKTVAFVASRILEQDPSSVTIIIIPTLSLIDSMVAVIKKFNFCACTHTHIIQSPLGLDEFIDTTDFLLMTPEFFISHVQTFLKRIDQIRRIVLDECHTMFDWGDSFKDSYPLFASYLATQFNRVPKTLCSATISHHLYTNCVRAVGLNLQNLAFVKIPGTRDNIEINFAYNLEDPDAHLFGTLKDFTGQGSIAVYVVFRGKVVDLYERYCKEINSDHVYIYHADLTHREKELSLNSWLADPNGIIFTTIAFAMGVDKPNVRLIVQYGLQRDIEMFTQILGRAGRDDKKALSLNYFWTTSITDQKSLSESSSKLNDLGDDFLASDVKNRLKLSAVADFYYCTDICRRMFMQATFEEKLQSCLNTPGCEICDVCKNTSCTNQSWKISRKRKLMPLNLVPIWYHLSSYISLAPEPMTLASLQRNFLIYLRTLIPRTSHIELDKNFARFVVQQAIIFNVIMYSTESRTYIRLGPMYTEIYDRAHGIIRPLSDQMKTFLPISKKLRLLEAPDIDPFIIFADLEEIDFTPTAHCNHFASKTIVDLNTTLVKNSSIVYNPTAGFYKGKNLTELHCALLCDFGAPGVDPLPTRILKEIYSSFEGLEKLRHNITPITAVSLYASKMTFLMKISSDTMSWFYADQIDVFEAGAQAFTEECYTFLDLCRITTGASAISLLGTKPSRSTFWNVDHILLPKELQLDGVPYSLAHFRTSYTYLALLKTDSITSEDRFNPISLYCRLTGGSYSAGQVFFFNKSDRLSNAPHLSSTLALETYSSQDNDKIASDSTTYNSESETDIESSLYSS